MAHLPECKMDLNNYRNVRCYFTDYKLELRVKNEILSSVHQQ